MKRIPIYLALLVGGFLLVGANGCSSDPNVEGAKLDLRNKDYDRALQNVNTALEKNPDNAQALDLKGQILQEQAFATQDKDEHTRMLNEMIQAYQRVLELDPGLAEDVNQRLRLAYYNEFQRGVQAFNRGRETDSEYSVAAEYFGNAALIQPDSADAFLNEGYALYNAGNVAEAADRIERSIEMGESAADTYSFLSSLYLSNDRAGDAVTLLEQARQKFPENVDIQAQLLNAYNAAGQADRAMQIYSESVAKEPNNKLFRYNFGSLLLNAERYDEAIEQLTVATTLDPEYADAFYNLGASYVNKAYSVNERMGEMDDALRTERANLSQDQITAREKELDQLGEERRSLYEQAITPLERARQLMESAGEDEAEVDRVCNALFGAYVQTGQDDKAKEAAACAGININ